MEFFYHLYSQENIHFCWVKQIKYLTFLNKDQKTQLDKITNQLLLCLKKKKKKYKKVDQDEVSSFSLEVGNAKMLVMTCITKQDNKVLLACIYNQEIHYVTNLQEMEKMVDDFCQNYTFYL